MTNLLSIITINYNNLEGLKRTVESVINQSWKELEYIVIDGGSTDGSVAYLESQNDKITYWISEKDKGVYHAMNKGIRSVNGEYVLFLNSGDHFCNTIVLKDCNEFLKEKDLVFFDMKCDNHKTSWLDKSPTHLDFKYFITGTLPHPATFIKRDLFDKVGFYDETLKIVSDWKFFMESVCEYDCTYKKIDQTLSTFYIDGISSYAENNKLLHEERLLTLRSKFSGYLKNIKDLEVKKETVKVYLRTLKKSLIVKKYNIFFMEVLKVKPMSPLLKIELLFLGMSYLTFKKGMSRYSKLLKS